MKRVRNATLLVIVALAVLLVPSGCKTESRTEATSVETARIELMQKVPVFYEDFDFWNVNSLREDPDLAELYQIWFDRKMKFLEERYGIDSSGIKYFAEGEGLLDIIVAQYDIEALRANIAAEFQRDTRYPDIEVWKSLPPADFISSNPPSVTGGWVLAEGLLVRGANNSNVDDYLSVVQGQELSQYDRNAAEVLERLPEGLLVRIGRSAVPSPLGVVVNGMSVSKEEKTTLKWTNVYKFENDEASGKALANEYFKKIEDDFKKAQDELTKRGEPAPFSSFTIKQDGEFVEWSMLIEAKYMIALLFYG
ncbi:MAG: hypothetical protein PHF12_00295 [Candidatus Omnitrophica bacterium]|nr:hypothetical protein [Candidatus Omnitrophota bacterium]